MFAFKYDDSSKPKALKQQAQVQFVAEEK